jgi:hypothetical protein
MQLAGQATDWNIQMPWPRPPISLNHRHSPHERASLTRMIRDDTNVLARAVRLPKLDRVTLGLVWYPGNNQVTDADNIAPTLKAAIDGLRDAKVLTDDNGGHVLTTWQRVVSRRDDPFKSSHSRVLLVVHDATDDAPLQHYPPAQTGSLVSSSFGPGRGGG